jgi:glycosyltransferase involved in cell wall biosynthesis
VAHDGSRIDHVVSFRYPSYAVRHRSHVVWLNHRMREYYDLWDRFSATLSWKGRVKERLRRTAIHRVDRYLLTRHVTKVFAQSATIQRRLHRFGGIPSEVLHPPAPPRPYRCDGYGGELFAVSRLTPLKRIDLLVRALAEPAARHVRCTIAGDGEEAPRLRQLIREGGLESRITLLGAIDSAALVTQLARCRAVVFPACEEDYGLVTVEAFASGKAVVACTDGGGPAELIRDGENGCLCDPTPAALAAAMAGLADDQGLAERLGAGASRVAAALTWPDTVRRLLLQDAP